MIDMQRLSWLQKVREECRVTHSAAVERHREAGAARTRAREALGEARDKYGATAAEISAAQEKLNAAEQRFRELGADLEISRDKWSAASAVVRNCEQYVQTRGRK
jgi:hypothetical protein